MRVALTFDVEHPDRPNLAPDALEHILHALAEHKARATFFLQGRWVEAHPERARLIADAGHLVGSHSFYHARLPLLTDVGIEADVLAAERAIEEATGTSPRPWFRCPFGAGWDDAGCRASLSGWATAISGGTLSPGTGTRRERSTGRGRHRGGRVPRGPRRDDRPVARLAGAGGRGPPGRARSAAFGRRQPCRGR